MRFAEAKIHMCLKCSIFALIFAIVQVQNLFFFFFGGGGAYIYIYIWILPCYFKVHFFSGFQKHCQADFVVSS